MASGGVGGVVSVPAHGWEELWAPAKLTVSLRVTGVRDDGLHLLDAEMVTLALGDRLDLRATDDRERSDLEVVVGWPDSPGAWRDRSVGPSGDNLVTRALAAVGRSADVRLVKRVPPGAGLGGGSADAAAVLRWAGCTDPDVAVGLGSDVPFCVVGGRARVTGSGEVVEPLPYVERPYVLLLPPFGVDTAAVYGAWDGLAAAGRLPGPGTSANDLEAAALVVEPRLDRWRRALEEATGRTASLAGSGSTWFVEGEAAELGLADRTWLDVDGQRGLLVATGTTPPSGGGVVVTSGTG